MKWANEAIEDSSLRSDIDAEVKLLSNVVAPSLDGFAPADIATAGQAVQLNGTTLSFSSGAEFIYKMHHFTKTGSGHA